MTGPKKQHGKKSHKKHLSVDFENPTTLNGVHIPLSPESQVSPTSIENLTFPIHHERHPSTFTADQKVANLTQLNDTLVALVESLKVEKEKLMVKLAELKEQHEDNERKITAFSSGNREVEQMTDEALAEISSLRKNSFALAEKNTSLLAEQVLISDNKKRLETTLQETQIQLSESYNKVELAQSAAHEANTRVEVENFGILKRSSETKALNDEIEVIKALNSDKISVIQELRIRSRALEQENCVLSHDLEKVLEGAARAKREAESRRIEESNLQAKTADLHMTLEDASKRSAILSDQITEAERKVEELVAAVTTLHKDIDASRIQKEKILEDFQTEQEVNKKLGEEVFVAVSERKSIQHNLSSTLDSVSWSEDSTHQQQKQIADLQKQISALSEEKQELQESRVALEIAAKHLVRGSAEKLKLNKGEVNFLQEKVWLLEAAIATRTKDLESNEEKMWHLITKVRSVKTEFEKKVQLARYTVPIAATFSSTLALVCLFACIGFRKH